MKNNYTPKSNISIGYLKTNSKQTGVLDLKSTGIIHSIEYKPVYENQPPSNVGSDYMQNIINDSNKAYKNSQIQIGIKTGDDMAFINKTHNIRSRIEEIDDRLKEVGINKTEKRSLDDMKSELVKELEKLEISQEDPEMIKKLSIQVQELCNALTQSELQKQELIEHASTLQSENQNLQNVCQITAQILPELQASHEMIPGLQAQILELETTIQNNPNIIEPAIQEAALKTEKKKGEIKGEIKHIKMGIKNIWQDEIIKENLKYTLDKLPEITDWLKLNSNPDHDYLNDKNNESLIIGELGIEFGTEFNEW